MSNLIIFDLDGVITSEEAYWDAAGLTLHELIYSPRYWGLGANKQYHPATTAEESRRISRAIFPESEILALKARAINSNWDTCYAAVCLRFIRLLERLKEILPEEVFQCLFPLRPWDTDWLADFRKQLTSLKEQVHNIEIDANDASAHVQPSIVGAGLAPALVAFLAPALVAPDNWWNLFNSPIFRGSIGLELINRFDTYASEMLSQPIEGAFSRYSPFWTFCQDIFQEWYLGDDLYIQTYCHTPAQLGKPGCIHFEHPLLPLEQIHAALETLRQQNYVLGFATGRVRQEALYPLEMYGLLKYFDERHISTYDDIERAEAELRAHGDQILLSKPHPFQFLVAADCHDLETDANDADASTLRVMHRNKYLETITQHLLSANDTSSPKRTPFIVIGDSTSDILGGHAAGAITVAVLTGARTSEARTFLAQSSPDFTIDDMTKLPALLEHIDSLATIQRLQFTEREKAERLLQRWFERHMHVTTESVTLTPKAVSLNSFNGFYRINGEEYFFKTHVEEQGVVEEYYAAELLHQAGYNIVRPLRTIHEEGRQMVIYPVVRWPVLFDLVRAVETGNAGDVTIEMLALAEQRECHRLRDIYRSTLTFSTAEEHAQAEEQGGDQPRPYYGRNISIGQKTVEMGLKGTRYAPIHQLFWHRLTGGRFKSFYEGKDVPFPSTREITSILFDELLRYHWVINEVGQHWTLGELVERAKIVLHPARPLATVIGHGDAHFGNVFLEDTKSTPLMQPETPLARGYSPSHLAERRYLYFDPAFAGRHSPLLDVIKPLFHNVFATWMYFPQDIARDLQLSVSIRGMTIFVEHNYTLTPVRQAILQTKIEYLLTPLIAELSSQEVLPADWLEIMQLALMCCPLLTINLLDGARLPVAISWLGLAQAVQVGNSGILEWRIKV